MPANRQTKTSLGDRASHAAVLMTGQAIYVKAAALVLQLILAKLLLRDEFGLYGLALTVYSFAAMFHQAGVLEVLVARQRSFNTWASVGFWLSTTIGILAFLFTLLLAPVAARFYRTDDPATLVRLIGTLAIVFPISATGAVNRAKLQVQMRFRELAIIGMLVATLDFVLKVSFASMGFGAFSFAYGAIITSIGHLILCWCFAPIKIRFRPQVRRWKYLLNDGVMVVGSLVFMWVIEEGDYVVLGRFASLTVVGVYFFAYRMSRHVMSLLTFQMARVLFPALSQLSLESGKQFKAFVRAARLIAAVCFPICLLMASVADPIVKVCFEPKWYEAIPLMQIMCLGMTIRTMSWPVASLFKAQGRFRTHMILSAFSICLFFPLTILGTWLGSAFGLSIAVAVFYTLSTTLEFFVVMRPDGHVLSRFASVIVLPMLVSIVAVAIATAIGYLALPVLTTHSTIQHLVQIAVITIVSLVVYLPLIRWLAADVWQDALLRAKRLLPA